MGIGSTITMGFLSPDGSWQAISAVNPIPVGGVTASGAGVLQLATGEPVPTDPVPESGTFIVRTDPAPEPLAVVAESLTTFGSASAAAINVPYPDDIVTGDLLVACVVTNSQSATLTAPAGWELMQQQTITGDFRECGIYGYVVDGVPPTGTANFTSNESNRIAACMFRVTGASLEEPVLVAGGPGSRNTTVYTVPALVGSAGGLIISMTQGNSSSPNNPDPLAFSNALTQLAYVPSEADTGVTRTWVNVRYMLASVELASFTVTSPSSVASMGSEVLAIRGTA